MDLLQFLMLNYKLNGFHLRFEIKFFSLHASQNFSSKTQQLHIYLLLCNLAAVYKISQNLNIIKFKAVKNLKTHYIKGMVHLL